MEASDTKPRENEAADTAEHSRTSSLPSSSNAHLTTTETTTDPQSSRGVSDISAAVRNRNDNYDNHNTTTGPQGSRGVSGTSAVIRSRKDDYNNDYGPTTEITGEYWALYHYRETSALSKAIQRKGICVTTISNRLIEDHTKLNQFHDHLRNHQVNMIIEQPKLDVEVSSHRMSKVFGKLRNCALKARKVFLIAKSRNGHLNGLREFFEANCYAQTDHFWCSLGVKVYDTTKPICYVTIMWSNSPVDAYPWQCGKALSHVYELRQEKNEEEIKTGQSNPNQRAYEDWATSIILLLKMRPGGSYPT